MTGLAVVGSIIALGWMLRRTGVLSGDGPGVLNRVAFSAATPALLFTVMSRADLADLASPHMLGAVAAFAGAALTYAAVSALAFRDGFGRTVVGMTSSGFANNNNIGLPLTLFVLGDVHYAAIVLLMQTVLVTPAFLTALIAASGGTPSLRRILVAFVTNPIVLASAAGLTVAALGWSIPEMLMAPLDMVAATAIPLVLLAFGASLRGARPLGAGSPVPQVLTASAIKCVVMPAIAYAVAAWGFGMSGTDLFAAVLVAALPTGQMVFSYTARYGVAVTLARDTVLITTLGCAPVMVVLALVMA
nr:MULTISPECIES: AEC family transporter [Microbacterium]